MDFRIVVGGKDLDIPVGAERSFYVTKQSHDIRNLETREATFTKQITLPMSRNNVDILGDWIPHFSSFNSEAYTHLPCQVMMDGISVVNDAQFFVISVDQILGEIVGGIFGGDQQFFNQLSVDLISNLDWSSYNLDWDITNVANLVNNTTGIVVADAIYFGNKSNRDFEFNHISGTSFQVSDLDINRAGFFVFVKTIFDKILSNTSGLTYDLSSFDDTNYDILALACPMQKFSDTDSVVGAVGVVDANVSTPTPPGTMEEVEFPTITYDPQFIWTPPSAPADGSFFTITSAIVVEIKINISVDIKPDRAQDTGQNWLYLSNADGTIIYRTYLLQASETQTLTTNISDTINLAVNAGDTISLRADLKLANFTVLDKARHTGTFAVSFGSLDRFVQIENWIPKIKQRDFVRDLLQYFHMVPYEENGVVKFIRWEEITVSDPAPTPFKINETNGINSIVALPNSARTNIFKYKDNENVESDGFNSFYNVLNNTLPEFVTKVQSIYSGSDPSETEVFAASATNGRVSIPAAEFTYKAETANKMSVGGAGLTFAITDNAGLQAGDIIYVDGQRGEIEFMLDQLNGQFINAIGSTGQNQDWEFIRFKNVSYQTHIAEIRTNTEDVVLVYGNLTQAEPDNKVAIFDFKCFWANYLQKHYPNFIESVKKPLFLTFDVLLTPIQFAALTPQKPIYIQSLGGIFYLNKINQFKMGTLTRLELLRIEYETF